jgi:hypothetical protein
LGWKATLGIDRVCEISLIENNWQKKKEVKSYCVCVCDVQMCEDSWRWQVNNPDGYNTRENVENNVNKI